MPLSNKLYCLDSNCFIEPWKTFCAPHRMRGFWEKIDELAIAGKIFIPLEVSKELEKTEDDLWKWVNNKKYLVREPDERITEKWAQIAKDFPKLVDNIKQRSLADPWVVAHAVVEGAVVVTMEGEGGIKRVRIPDVCRSLNIECIGIFDFIDSVGFSFVASVKE